MCLLSQASLPKLPLGLLSNNISWATHALQVSANPLAPPHFYKFKSFYGNPEILFNLATLQRGSLTLSR